MPRVEEPVSGSLSQPDPKPGGKVGSRFGGFTEFLKTPAAKKREAAAQAKAAEEAEAAAAAAEAKKKKEAKKKEKIMSVKGTSGYMAPELLEVGLRRVAREKRRRVYGTEVDYWALGITMYKMLTGRLPFSKPGRRTRESDAANRRGTERELNAVLLNTLVFPAYVTSDACSLMTGLLQVDPRKRLGCGPRGVLDIKEHPYFQDLDFDALLRREIKPVFMPKEPQVSKNPQFETFEDMMSAFDKENDGGGIWGVTPGPEDQSKFSHWDFVSHQVVQDHLNGIESLLSSKGRGAGAAVQANKAKKFSSIRPKAD